jgi:hypothetical protein
MPREGTAGQPLCADIDGFSLHVAVRVESNDRKRLEQLCRYITRPALSDEGLQANAAGQLELKLETPWRDGLAGRARPVAGPFARHKQSTGLFVSGLSTTHLVMSPLQFMQRLAELVPRPRLHLIRFHGVLAPNAKLRPVVVPQRPEVQEQPTEVAVAGECEVETVRARPHRVSWARLLERVFWLRRNLSTSRSSLKLRFRHRHAALPELRRRGTEDHRGHPGAAGDREDPDSPGPGSAATTPRAGVRGGGARLRSLSHALNHAGRHEHHAPGTTPQGCNARTQPGR